MKQYRTTAQHRPRRAGIAVAVATALSLLAAGCAAGPAPSDEPTAEEVLAADQSLVIGLSGEPQDVRPGADQGAVGTVVDSLLHQGLLRYDDKAQIVPGLASEFEKVDPKTYEFTLRDGVAFSDGTPITSETVKNTFAFYGDPANGAKTIKGFANIEEFEIVDDSTFTVHLKTNDGDFLQYAADPTAFVAEESALVPQGVAAVGAGPFTVAESVDGVSTTLEKNPEYWDADNVILESIELVFYPDTAARTNALISGDVDLIDFVAWEDFDRIAATDGLVMDAQPGSLMDVEFNVTEGPFADPIVRQAVGYALDRDAIAAAAFSGHAKPVYGVPLGEGSPFASDLNENIFSYDPEKAKELLAEAGYEDGFSATLLTTSQYIFYQDTALVVQANLAEIGIDVTLDSGDWPTRNEKSLAGDYDIRISGGGGVVTSPAYIPAALSGSALAKSFGWDDPDLLAAFDAGRTADTEEEAKKAYDKAFKLFAEATPMVYVVQREQGFAYKDTLKGFVNLPGFLTFYSGDTLAGARITE